MIEIDLRQIFVQKAIDINTEITLKGWIRNHRKQSTIGFIDFFDGTTFESIQVTYFDTLEQFKEIRNFGVGAAIQVCGKLVRSEHNGQLEVIADKFQLLGDSPEDYPLQPKRHSLEFLREIAYLRPRTRLFQAVYRVRSVAAMAIHEYFQDLGYLYVHTPLLTTNDGEGAGESFTVTALDLQKPADFAEDFFGKQTSLAVTGQLEGEAFAMAFKKIYTFGPTFRAENSNTKTHLAEFWMIEPEIAFCDLDQLMDIQEDFLKKVTQKVLDKCLKELEFLATYHKIDLLGKLEALVQSNIVRISHDEVIQILKDANEKFEFVPEFGEDLAKEHEKYLTEKHFGTAVFVHSWPKDIKAFYMKVNDDEKTVAAVDLIVPGSGELMGGSQREARYKQLFERMKEMDIPTEDLYWYLNLRKFGTCDHAGFGLGFERLIMYLTGIENIRDVIPFPRTPMNCEF